MQPELMTTERIANLKALIPTVKEDYALAEIRLHEAKTKRERAEAERDMEFYQDKLERCECNLKQLKETEHNCHDCKFEPKNVYEGQTLDTVLRNGCLCLNPDSPLSNGCSYIDGVPTCWKKN